MRLITIIVSLHLSLLAGCSKPAGAGGSPNVPELQRVRIDSIHTQPGVTGRFVLMLPAGPCVVYQEPPADKTPGDETQRFLDLEGVEHIRDLTASYWGQRPGPLTGFNCGTYAVGEVIGLGPSDWLEPVVTPETLFQNPVQLVLDSYFDLVATHTLPVDWRSLERDTTLHNKDVICFASGAGEKQTIVHLGIIDIQDQVNLVRSKLGEGPIVRTPLEITAQHYFSKEEAAQVKQLLIYRKRG